MSTPWRPQKDGSTYQWVNCSLVAIGRLMKRQLAGVRTPSTNLAAWNSTITKLSLGWSSTLPTMASAMRVWILAHLGSGFTGGISIPNSMKAAIALWGPMPDSGYRWDVSTTTMKSYVKAGRGVHTIIDYDVVHAYPNLDGCRSFNDRHSIFLDGWRLHTWTDSTGVSHSREEYLVDDSLADHRLSWIPQGPQWWPCSLVHAGASKSIGVAGNCEFGYSRDTTV